MMKQVNSLYSILVCMLLMCMTACDKENNIIDERIPLSIESDFSKRYPVAEITSSQNNSDGSLQIDFIDEQQNQASTWYQDETWKMTHTKIENIDQLPLEVQQSFQKTGYGDAQIAEIYKTERDGMAKSLYTLHFQYRWKKVENVEHYVLINNDGVYLTTLTWEPNDPCWFVNLPEDHFNFIAEKYKGAEIRGYVNNGGRHEYFISHQDSLKVVSFMGTIASERYFWSETRYELSLDTKIPDNVANVLNRNHPGFTYTHLFYIESDEGNKYHFIDKNHDNDLGYCISENIE